MNVTNTITREYENKTLGECGKKQSQSKPIKANSNPISANKIPTCRGVALGEDGNKPKTNPNKPNFKGQILINRWQNHSNIPLISKNG